MTKAMMKKINPKNLKVGDTVTILEWTSHKDNSWKGDLISIKAINQPYIFAEITKQYGEPSRHRFDSRGVIFAEVTDDYVENVLWLKGEKK